MLTPDFQPFLALFQLSFDGIAIAVPDPWRIVFVNSTLSQWSGRPLVQSEDWPLDRIFAADSLPALQQRLEQVWQSEDAAGAISANLVQAGERPALIPVEIRVARLAHLDQPFVGIVVRKTDAGKPMVAAGRRDPLTGLADRSELLARLATLLGGDRSGDQQFAVLFIDLDDFKEVNDRYGHLIGDRVLSEAAQRLVRCTRAGDQVFRYGGDEFVVVVERVAAGCEIEPVVCRIHDELAQPIAIPNGLVSLSVSVGVAELSAAHRTPEDLLFDADCAMYAAKRQQSSVRLPR
jgi:diguanylate cyclase (GGDEF)-like protein